MFSAHRHPTAFANHVFSPTAQQTNGYLGTRLTQIQNTTKFNKQQAIRQTLRVEFTLMKLQEEYPEKKQSQRQITQAHKIINQQKEQLNENSFRPGKLKRQSSAKDV